MSLGRSPKHEDLFRSTKEMCESRLPERSIFRLLAARSHELFADRSFADLFAEVGRNSVPPRIVAVVLVLQRYTGMSDREAVDAFTFDARWKYAAGALDFDHPGFVHTVLVDMRERLRRSERPNRIFDVVIAAARDAGFIGKKRVLDSTALYDAVATQDTVTLVRSALVRLLDMVDAGLAAQMRAAFERDDDYRKQGKPTCDWDDEKAREALIDSLAKDGFRALWLVHGRTLEPRVREAAQLLATVIGQDIERRDDGVFRLLRGVTQDRIISTVDPEARHGHKTAARGFDGYKGHVSVDPDSELIVATEVTAGNVGDAQPAPAMLEEALEPANRAAPGSTEIYGDSSYGTATLVEHIEEAGAEAHVKVQPPSAKQGRFAQDAFAIDTTKRTATCPAGVLVPLRVGKHGAGIAEFATHCASCPLRAQCTDSLGGRTVRTHPKHDLLHRYRSQQRDPSWKQRYRQTRPKVERKLAHMMRRKHGGRRARVRGRLRVAHDFALLAAAINLARLAVLSPSD